MKTKSGLGELLRHLVELTDGSTDEIYKSLEFNYRPRYTPIMRALEHGSMSISDLRDQLSITQGAISQAIKLMAQDNLIEKSKGEDARQSIISLSSHGEAVLHKLTPHWEAIFKAIEHLESDIQLPLMLCLQRTINALEQQSFTDRIEKSVLDSIEENQKNTHKQYFLDNGERYAEFRPTYPTELASSLASLVTEQELAVDIGCGNGQLTTLLSPHFKHVVGIDSSANQLHHAKPANNVQYLHKTAENIELPNNSADLIVAAQAAHWFDLDVFYSEVRRVSKQNAIIALISYGVPYIPDAVNAVFQKGYWQDIHEFWPPERQHVETGYSDLYFPFTEMTLPNYNYQQTMIVEEFIMYIKTWSAYKVAENAQELEKFNKFFEHLRRAWKNGESKEVIWPISIKGARIKQ